MVGVAVLVIAAIVALILTGVVRPDNLADIVVWLVAVISVIYFVVILSSRKITTDERSRVFSFIPMFIASVAFWSLYQQQFTVVTAYSDQRLNRDLFGWTMPVSWVQSINPVFIIVFAPLMAALWTKLAERQPSTPVTITACGARLAPMTPATSPKFAVSPSLNP